MLSHHRCEFSVTIEVRVVAIARAVLIRKRGISSLLRFAVIESIKDEKNLGDLAPKRVLVAAEPVERVGRQTGETKKHCARWHPGSATGSATGSPSRDCDCGESASPVVFCGHSAEVPSSPRASDLNKA
jgi:hypothetical protein